MALDPGIFGLVQHQQPQFNPLAELAQIQQLQAGRQQNQLATLALQDRERSLADAAVQREAVKGFGADTTANYNRLLQTGNLSAAQNYQKGTLDAGKTQAEMGKISAETDDKTFSTLQQMFGSVQDPRQAAALLQSAYADPRTAAVMKRFGSLEEGMQVLQQASQNPQAFQQWRAQVALGVDGLAKSAKVNNVNLGGTMQTQVFQPATGQVQTVASAPITQSADNRATQDTSRANNAAQVGVTLRGQDLTDARSREANSAGRVPAGYRQRADGGLEFIPGGPADPNAAKKASPTEFQGKSAAFGARAQEADRLITDLVGKYSPAAINSKQAVGKVWGVGGALEAGGNALLTSEGQRAEQAQRDFINAVLRQESGAAIADSEFDNARRQYFPQPNDTKAVIDQKAANRRLAVRGLLNNAGNAAMSPQSAGDGWTVQEVRK